MIRLSHPLPALRRPLTAMLSMWLLGAGMAGLGIHFRQQVLADHQRTIAAREAAARQLRDRQTLGEQWDKQLQTWRALRQAGHDGAPDPAVWSAQLQEAGRELGLGDLRASFGTPRRLDSARDGPGWLLTPLHLELRLRHEEDLSRLLERLRQQARARMAVQGCRLASADGSPETSGLQAECDVDWLTLSGLPESP